MCRSKRLWIKFLRGQFEHFQIRKSVVDIVDVIVIVVFVVDVVVDVIVIVIVVVVGGPLKTSDRANLDLQKYF